MNRFLNEVADLMAWLGDGDAFLGGLMVIIGIAVLVVIAAIVLALN